MKFSEIKAVKSLAVLIFVFLFFGKGFGKNYYVSTTGNNSSNGSVTAPFKTIAKAAGMVTPGDTVFVNGGVYFEENISPASSGTENAIIVFMPNPGTGEVIIKHPGTSINDNNPVFSLSSKNHIWIKGFSFKDFSYGKAAINISRGGNNVVINNRFENLGNREVGSWDGNTIVWLGWTTQNVIRNNYFINCFGDGIGYFGSGCTHNLISNNTFIGFKGKLRSWGGSYEFSAAAGGGGDVPDGNNIFAFNYSYDVRHAIWLDRHGSGNILLRNYANTGDNGIFNESRCAQNIVQENISLNMKNGFMSSHYENTGWTIEPRWINNIAYNNKIGFNIHKSERDEFRNNIAFNNKDFNLIFTEEALSNAPHIFESNLWYSSDNPNSIEFKDSPVTVADFQNEIGENNGLSANPMFVSTVEGNEDFALQATSPAKNAGDNGLDLGAFAAYPATPFGWDSTLQLAGRLVYFETMVSSFERGTTVQFSLKLNKPADESISVKISPVAGDARIGSDFTLSDTIITFSPGELSKNITVSAIDSSMFDKIVALQISGGTNGLPGARNLHLIRINKTPQAWAFAGFNQTIWDSDNNGSEDVELDASLSNSDNDSIVSYTWSHDGTIIATGVNPTVSLAVGTHTLVLEVTDNLGNTDTDEVQITISESNGIWLEAECGTVGSLWDEIADEEASNGQYVTIKEGNNSTGSAPVSASGLLSYTFDISSGGNYFLKLRVHCPNANDDSFWLKMDNGSYSRWNDIASSTGWAWRTYSNTFYLGAGTHELAIGYREDGAKLDKIWLTTEDMTISDAGASATNCTPTSVNSRVKRNSIDIYPNPVTQNLTVTLNNKQADLSIFNSNGVVLFNRKEEGQNCTVDMSGFKPGIYIIKIILDNQIVIKKIVKQ
ncbi:T9SS type A sorting domain-containing protein [uncultured Draconibacterium sp.]|uniref:T9SS type A sorting domain-containing protein n=1 Tax=uncultured Draconibacterium sp. TaxID=1573823 RepID=UPI003260FA2D